MSSHRRIQDIERLRAIAALAVLIGHVPWLQVGVSHVLHVPFDPWTGVDLFFVISGFVVSSAFERDLADHASGTALKAFYRKRAARILPTAYIGLAVWWIGVTWFNQSGAWGQPLHGAAAAGMTVSGLLLVSNYAQVFAGITMPLFWYWSICVEEHFYVLYPGFRIVVGTVRRRIVAVLAVIVVVQVMRFAWSDQSIALMGSLARFDQLGLGVLIGLLRQRWAGVAATAASALRAPGPVRNSGIVAMLLLLVALGALPVTLLLDQASLAGRVGYLLAGLCAGAIVALASCDADLLGSSRSLVASTLSKLGARSYGIYMFHGLALWIVVEIRFRLFQHPSASWLYVPELAAYALVLAAMVEANYRWNEMPLIAWARGRSQ